jgi:uncharacterized protein YecE (DUF72 family)
LQAWARDIRRWRRQRRDAYCFLDNDRKSAAPKDAERLEGIGCGETPACPLEHFRSR